MRYGTRSLDKAPGLDLDVTFLKLRSKILVAWPEDSSAVYTRWLGESSTRCRIPTLVKPCPSADLVDGAYPICR